MLRAGLKAPATLFFASTMLSSPASSLPPSSAPVPSTYDSQSVAPGSPQNTAQPDALNLDEAEAENENEADGAPGRRRRRPRARNNGDVPVVTDPVGEALAQTFEEFLKT